jgi:hypothetical protein
MQHTSETHEIYGCNMCSSTCCHQWTLVDTDLDAGTELEVAHNRQANGSRPWWEARSVRHKAWAGGEARRGSAARGAGQAGRPV